MDSDSIDLRYNYHAPDDKAKEAHEIVREQCRGLAHMLNELLPEDGFEKFETLKKLDEVMFFANAAIARNGARRAADSQGS